MSKNQKLSETRQFSYIAIRLNGFYILQAYTESVRDTNTRNLQGWLCKCILKNSSEVL